MSRDFAVLSTTASSPHPSFPSTTLEPPNSAAFDRELAATVRTALQAARLHCASGEYDEVVSRWLEGGGDWYGGLAEEKEPEARQSSVIAHLRELRLAVMEYTRTMRRIGHYPERVLVTVKTIVREVGTPHCGAMLDQLIRGAAQWSITAYFDTDLACRHAEEQREQTSGKSP
jgi:hypothetical protein